MNTDEIRANNNRNDWEFLREIAAQLADSNELKRLEVEAINNLCGVVNLLQHEGGALNKLAGSAESVAVSLDILVNRGRV